MDQISQNKITVWKEFATQVGGKYIERYSWHSDKTEIEFKNRKVVFDNFTLWSGKYSTEMTRIVSPIVSADNFRFQIYRKGLVRNIEKFFGAQDIEIGNPEFDKAFIIKSNSEFKIKSFLRNKIIRNLIELQKEVNIEVSDQKGIWEEKLPEKELEISFYVDGKLKDIDSLKLLLNLFMEMLDELDRMKSILW